MTDRELMQMALDALRNIDTNDRCFNQREAIVFLRERLSQPEPIPKGYQKTKSTTDDIWSITVKTTPPKREWVGLTDEERGMVVNANFGIGVWEMARAVEAKLKEKNT